MSLFEITNALGEEKECQIQFCDPTMHPLTKILFLIAVARASLTVYGTGWRCWVARFLLDQTNYLLQHTQTFKIQ